MARSQSSQANTAVIHRALATAQKEIERTKPQVPSDHSLFFE